MNRSNHQVFTVSLMFMSHVVAQFHMQKTFTSAPYFGLKYQRIYFLFLLFFSFLFLTFFFSVCPYWPSIFSFGFSPRTVPSIVMMLPHFISQNFFFSLSIIHYLFITLPLPSLSIYLSSSVKTPQNYRHSFWSGEQPMPQNYRNKIS